MRVLRTPEGFYLESVEGRVAISETAYRELERSFGEQPRASASCTLCGGTGLRCMGSWPWGKGYDVCACRSGGTI